MNCCCTAIDSKFNEKIARRDLKSYRENGPGPTARILLYLLRSQKISNASLLDIGAGVGALHHELLGEVADHATHIEASKAYLSHAQSESRQRGNEDRVKFVHGDFIDLAENLAEADIVTLDRVICCYPNLEQLLLTSCKKARKLYAVTYPRDRLLVKWMFTIENMIRTLRGLQFRTFVYSNREIQHILEKAGLQKISQQQTFTWRAEVYSR